MTDTISVTGPSEQLSIYEEEAEELGCSLSQYAKMMMNAGRREFGYVAFDDAPTDEVNDVLQLRIKELLASEGPLSNEEIEDALIEQLRTEIGEALSDLQDQNEIEFDYTQGGIRYVG